MAPKGESSDTSKGDPSVAVPDVREPRLIAFLLADWGLVAPDGKVVLGGVFDRLRVSSEGNATFTLYLRTAGTVGGRVLIEFVDSQGSVEASLQTSLDERIDQREGVPDFLESLEQLRLVFSTTGLHWARVTYGNDVLGMIPFDVSVEGNDGDPRSRDTFSS